MEDDRRMTSGGVTTTVTPSGRPDGVAQPEAEVELIGRLVEAAARAGVVADRVSIVNCYVALKSKPLAILVGPGDSGKVALVKSLAQVLVGPECWRCQLMLGHAWWATGSSNVALFTEAQARFIASKVFDLVADALHPQNADRVFMGCLTHISPAELVGFFSEVAYQLRHGQLMQLPSFHLGEPIPYPPNLFLLGTVDAEHFGGWDDGLLSHATVLLWPPQAAGKEAAMRAPLLEDRSATTGCRPGEAETCFLLSSVRSQRAALRRLHSVPGWRPALMRPLWEMDELLRDYAVPLPETALAQALIYVANAWSQRRQGLFDPAMGCNLMVAMDLAILQTLLFHATERLCDSAVLHNRSMDMLGARFPRSAAFVSNAH